MWLPQIPEDARPFYRALADAMGKDIAAGRLVAGARLPPQRDLAEALGVTVPTITRAYALAARVFGSRIDFLSTCLSCI